jgi:hypothetical protein
MDVRGHHLEEGKGKRLGEWSIVRRLRSESPLHLEPVEAQGPQAAKTARAGWLCRHRVTRLVQYVKQSDFV